MPIPEFCPLCKHKVIWSSHHKGHMVQKQCQDLIKASNLLKDIDSDLARKLEWNVRPMKLN